MSKKLSLEYIIRQPNAPIKNPPLLILLHGYGSNEQDLFSFASELPDDLLIISARAPLTLGPDSYSWYTINFDMNNGKFSDTDEAIISRDKIAHFIDEITSTYDVNKDNVFLLGFSQGTILSYSVALNYPEKVKHVIALSGYINQDLLKPNYRINNFNQLDFFISHGSVDQVIPVEWAQNAAPFLNDLNLKNSYKEYMVGHGVAPQNFHDFKKWITERI
jgi:phospholipase/carboxylesterase|tara:strand:- start:6824 stop:7480 length:657 start_codon:yes stop_codon:yes gene_type:complete